MRGGHNYTNAEIPFLVQKMEFVELAQPCKTLEVVVYNEWSGIEKLVGGSPGGVANRVVFHLGSWMAFRFGDGRITSFYIMFLNEGIFKH